MMMRMPKVAIDKNSYMLAGQGDIWCAWESAVVFTIAQAVVL